MLLLPVCFFLNVATAIYALVYIVAQTVSTNLAICR